MIRRFERWIVISIAFFAVLLVVAMAAAGGRDVLAHLVALQLHLVLGLLALALCNYALRALRWQAFARQRGLDVPFHRQLIYYVAGFALTITPGKLGEAMRLWLLRQGHGIAYERTGSLLLADRLSDAVALVLLAAIGVSGFAKGWASGWTSLAVIVAALAVVVAVIFRPRWSLAILDVAYARFRHLPRLFVRLRRLVKEANALIGSSTFLAMVLLSMLGWFAEVLSLHWLLVSLGYDIGLADTCFVFAFSMLAGSASMLPGGLGGTEAGMVVLLIGLDVPADVAIAATAIIRLTTLWFAVGLGVLTLPLALRVTGVIGPVAAKTTAA